MSTSRRIRRASRRTKAFRKDGNNGSWSQELPRPMRHLAALTSRYPWAWEVYDYTLRAGTMPDPWPEWVYCPFKAAYSVVAPGPEDEHPAEVHLEAERISALAAWRRTKGIYRLDRTLLDHLLAAPIERIPSDTLLRLPEWGVYVEFPEPRLEMRGFFAHFDSVLGGPTDLHILVDGDTEEDDGLIPLLVRLTDDLGEAVRKGFQESDFHRLEAERFFENSFVGGRSRWSSPEELYRFLVTPLLSVLLYLCSEEPEIEKERGPAAIGAPRLEPRSRPERAVELPTVWKTGFKLGKQLRKVESSPHQGSTVRPHMRRAHWHTYRVGKGRNRVELRWIVPTPVGFKGVPEFATVRETE